MTGLSESFFQKDRARRMCPTRNGLTRTEVVVVLMCLFLFFMLIVPSIMQQRETQRKVACQERMQALSAGLLRSAEKNNDRFPPLVREGIPWTVGILGNIEQQASILDRLTNDPIAEQPPIAAPIFLCPNGQQYEPGRNCYIVNGGWGDFEVDPVTKFVNETTPHTISLDWDQDDTVSEQEREWTRATGVIWRAEDAEWSWKPDELDGADGRSQTILLSETQNSRSWMSIETFDLAFVVGRDDINFGEQPHIFDLNPTSLGPYAINSSMGDRRGHCPAPSSLHTGGVNILFADGAIRAISAEIDPLVFLRLMTPGGTQFGEIQIDQRDPEPADTGKRGKHDASNSSAENE